MSMILLQTVTLEQYNTEFRAIDRGLWYTQTEDGTHCFRFDLRFGCVKVFCSKDEVTVRATTFEGKTRKMGRVRWENGKARIVGYETKKGRKQFTSSADCLDVDPFINLLLGKMEGSPYQHRIWETVTSGLLYMTLAHCPWRFEEESFLKDMRGYNIKGERPPFVLHHLMYGLLFPYQPHRSVDITPARNIGFGVFRKPTKQVAKALFGNKGKQACKTVPFVLKHSWSTKVQEAFKAAQKAGWEPQHIIELTPTITALGANFKELVPYGVNLVKKLSPLSEEETFHPDRSYFQDMVENLQKLNSMGLGKFPLKKARNLKHAHDAVAYAVNNADTEDFELWQHPELSQFDDAEIGGYRVVFPKLESDLKQWGRKLGICIGGYGRQVHTGESVCFALYESDKLAGCVEFRVGLDGHKLYQAEGHCAEKFSQELLQAIADRFGIGGESRAKEGRKKFVPAQERRYQRLVNPDREMNRKAPDMTEEQFKALCKEALYVKDPNRN